MATGEVSVSVDVCLCVCAISDPDTPALVSSIPFSLHVHCSECGTSSCPRGTVRVHSAERDPDLT